MPSSAAITRGRSAVIYATPVTRSSTAAATTDMWSRPCTARSIRRPAASRTHAHQPTIAVTDRKVCGPTAPSGVAFPLAFEFAATC